MPLPRETIEEHLRQAEEHVASGERAIARQLVLLQELARDGHDTARARKLLGQFEELQAMHIADRDRIRKALAELDQEG